MAGLVRWTCIKRTRLGAYIMEKEQPIEKISRIIPPPPKPPIPPKSRYICTSCGVVDANHKCTAYKTARIIFVLYILCMLLAFIFV